MTSSPAPLPRANQRRKFVLALLVLMVSLGALGWQISAHRRRMAEVSALGERRSPIEWRKATDAERKAVIASITNQLDAFKRDDYQAATKYQSQDLQRNFPSVAEFRAMMQRSYPQFTRYKSVQFGAVQADEKGKLATVPVKLTGRDGVLVSAVYQMILEEGLWRVSGVFGGNTGVPAPPKPPAIPVSA